MVSVSCGLIQKRNKIYHEIMTEAHKIALWFDSKKK